MLHLKLAIQCRIECLLLFLLLCLSFIELDISLFTSHLLMGALFFFWVKTDISQFMFYLLFFRYTTSQSSCTKFWYAVVKIIQQNWDTYNRWRWSEEHFKSQIKPISCKWWSSPGAEIYQNQLRYLARVGEGQFCRHLSPLASSLSTHGVLAFLRGSDGTSILFMFLVEHSYVPKATVSASLSSWLCRHTWFLYY